MSELELDAAGLPGRESTPPPQSHERKVASNAGVLFAGQAVGLVAPLLVVPYLARVLGPAGWAPVLIAQSLANWLVVVLEFAFDLSGTRELARARSSESSLETVVHSVQSAKLLLILLCVPLALIIGWSVPLLRTSPALTLAALGFAVLRGLSPLWYFQGLERVRGAVAVESLSRVAAAAGALLLVHSVDDGWRVLALQGVFAGVALVWLTRQVIADVGFRLPDLRLGRRTVREHVVPFACRASAGVYAQANALILGAMAPGGVAFFGGAERIVRAAINLLYPMNQAVLPRVSFLRESAPDDAHRLVRRSFFVMGAIGTMMTVVAFFGAPLLVRVLLGPAYGAAVPLLRLLSVLPLLVAINSVLGMFWALPFGHERGFLAAILAAGATNLLLAGLLVPRFGATGMALAAIGAEVVVLAVLLRLYLR